MASVPDLCESQLWVTVTNLSRSYPVEPLRRQMHLRLIAIEVGSRPIAIKKFTAYESPYLGYFYMFMFPKTEEALDKLTPY